MSKRAERLAALRKARRGEPRPPADPPLALAQPRTAFLRRAPQGPVPTEDDLRRWDAMKASRMGHV